MDSRSRAIRRSFHAIALSVVLIGAPSAGRTATRYVTNDGVDSSSCGSTSDHACRSISQGIENASDGDTILVGAGRYGDLNGNGDYSDPGDEHPMNTGEDVSCIVCITKSVTILSYSGTAATTIEGGGEYQSVVQPLVDRVTFGAKNQGFTIAGGLYGFWLHEQGLNNGNPGTLKHGISVVGNVAVNSSIGFEFDGQPYRPPQGCPDSLCLSTGRVVFAQNTALNTGTGFAAVQNLAAGPVVFQDNLAEFASGTGFNVSPGFQYGQFFSAISAGGIQLIHNVATHSGYGFGTVLPGIMENNLASDNTMAGFVVVAGDTTFKGNSASGNQGPGVIVLYADPRVQVVSTFVMFAQNDFVGNDRNRPTSGYAFVEGSYDPGPAAHCGVLNLGELASVNYPIVPALEPVTLKAADNYWGAASGPSASGPADAVGGACDQNLGTTVGKPFSTRWFPLIPLPQ